MKKSFILLSVINHDIHKKAESNSPLTFLKNLETKIANIQGFIKRFNFFTSLS